MKVKGSTILFILSGLLFVVAIISIMTTDNLTSGLAAMAEGFSTFAIGNINRKKEAAAESKDSEPES